MCDCKKCTKEREHRKFIYDLEERLGEHEKWKKEYDKRCAKQARDGRLFCKKCLIADYFFRGGGSWAPDVCPECGGYECVTYGSLGPLAKYRAQKLFDKMWEEQWGVKRKSQ